MPNQSDARAALQQRRSGTAVQQPDGEQPDGEQSAAKQPSINEMLSKPQVQEQIRMALPNAIDSKRFTRIVLTAVHASPDLQACTFQSLVGAALQSAQLGLEPNTPLGHAALVPYKGKASFQLQYKGLIELAYRSPRIMSIDADMIYKADEYQIIKGTEPSLWHHPRYVDADGNPIDRGPVILWYAVAKFRDGGHRFVVLNRADVEYHRSFSKMKNGPAWKNSYNAMGLKTSLIELNKVIPQAVELASALAVDESVQEEWRENMAEHYAAEHANDPVGPMPGETEPPEPEPGDPETQMDRCQVCGNPNNDHAQDCPSRPFEESEAPADGEVVDDPAE